MPHARVNEVIFPAFAINLKPTPAPIVALDLPMERDMNIAIASYLERSSGKTACSFDGLVSAAIFSGLGVLTSLSVLLLDRYIPGDWF
jgi:hypothetical protein